MWGYSRSGRYKCAVWYGRNSPRYLTYVGPENIDSGTWYTPSSIHFSTNKSTSTCYRLTVRHYRQRREAPWPGHSGQGLQGRASSGRLDNWGTERAKVPGVDRAPGQGFSWPHTSSSANASLSFRPSHHTSPPVRLRHTSFTHSWSAHAREAQERVSIAVPFRFFLCWIWRRSAPLFAYYTYLRQ